MGNTVLSSPPKKLRKRPTEGSAPTKVIKLENLKRPESKDRVQATAEVVKFAPTDRGRYSKRERSKKNTESK